MVGIVISMLLGEAGSVLATEIMKLPPSADNKNHAVIV